MADEAAAPPPPAPDEDTLRAPAVSSAAVNHEPVPMHVALDQVSDEVLEQEYRRRYLHGQSTANRSFNRDEY